jgi:hypothetical protein
MKGLR